MQDSDFDEVHEDALDGAGIEILSLGRMREKMLMFSWWEKKKKIF